MTRYNGEIADDMNMEDGEGDYADETRSKSTRRSSLILPDLGLSRVADKFKSLFGSAADGFKKKQEPQSVRVNSHQAPRPETPKRK